MVSHPVVTETTRCQDCARCLRACPVEAIAMEGGHARIRAAACIACGRCVAACPTGSQRVRDDLPGVQALVAAGGVAASVAPSWPAAFPGTAPGALVAALRRLGFARVAATAAGAVRFTAAMDACAAAAPDRLHISPACPAVVAWVRRHRTDLLPALPPIASPAMLHARQLAAAVPGPVVLIAPCIAKKLEADEGPDLAAALTFADLARWFAAAGIDPREAPAGAPADGLAGGGPGESYALEGGMAAAMSAPTASCSGIEHLARWFAGTDPASAATVVEALACPGGCLNGPGFPSADGLLARRARILGRRRPEPPAPAPPVDAAWRWPPAPEAKPPVDERALATALAAVGKRTPADELDCGACGYGTCRDLARAVARGQAEPDQCLAWMRRLAQRQANALLHAVPAGAVLVDGGLRVIEANARFAALAGRERIAPGIPLGEVVSWSRLFRHVLDGHGDLVERDIRAGGRVLHGSIFTIDPGRVAGAVLVDHTVPALGRAEVARRAGEALTKHLEAVQRIAWLLGENAAEVETLLGSIVDAHRPAESGDA